MSDAQFIIDKMNEYGHLPGSFCDDCESLLMKQQAEIERLQITSDSRGKLIEGMKAEIERLQGALESAIRLSDLRGKTLAGIYSQVNESVKMAIAEALNASGAGGEA